MLNILTRIPRILVFVFVFLDSRVLQFLGPYFPTAVRRNTSVDLVTISLQQTQAWHLGTLCKTVVTIYQGRNIAKTRLQLHVLLV